MGLVRVGERMKRARRRMAVAEMVARTERRRRRPNIVVVFAARAVSEVDWKGGVVYRSVGEKRWYEAEREEGYWVRAKSYLVFLTAVYHTLQLSEAEEGVDCACIAQRACI